MCIRRMQCDVYFESPALSRLGRLDRAVFKKQLLHFVSQQHQLHSASWQHLETKVIDWTSRPWPTAPGAPTHIIGTIINRNEV